MRLDLWMHVNRDSLKTASGGDGRDAWQVQITAL